MVIKSLIVQLYMWHLNNSYFRSDSSLPAVGFQLPGPESRHQLWNKANQTLRYVYQNYLNEYDWFLKADDDT